MRFNCYYSLARRENGVEQERKKSKIHHQSQVGTGEVRKRALFSPTIQEIESDPLTKIANENWRNVEKPKFSSDLVLQIYNEIQASQFAFSRIMLLEFSHYLEKYFFFFFFLIFTFFFLNIYFVCE